MMNTLRHLYLAITVSGYNDIGEVYLELELQEDSYN